MTTTRSIRPGRRTALFGAILGVTALAATACPVETPTAPGGTTTTAGPTSTTASPIRTLTNATFEWTISAEANHGSNAPGQVNYWSAGQSDSLQGTYVPTSGNATVLKKNASGTYVPIGSESAVSWANRNKDGNGVTVTANSANYLGQKIRYTGGTGTVNTATGAATIQWTGTFSINFYGKYVPFWLKNPKLVVTAGGAGTLTATMAGFASSLENPDVRTPLAETLVTVANFTGISGANTTGFTKAPNYLGTSVTTPADQAAQVAQSPGNASYWGAWPQSFVDFQGATGLASYWYSSGGSADPAKPTDPVTVAYNL